jgi:hypothetical protein
LGDLDAAGEIGVPEGSLPGSPATMRLWPIWDLTPVDGRGNGSDQFFL